MEANEIMTGDIVRIKETGKVIQITVVDASYETVDYFDADAEGELTIEIRKIEPIPLTAEILEKNGFKKEVNKNNFESYLYYNFAGDGFIRVILWDGGDGDWSIKIGNYDKFDDNEIIYKNDFVFLKLHQLQHALRLCGIDKTIEL